MADERLVLYVESRPMLAVGRLRFHMEQRGFLLVPPGKPAPSTGFSAVVRPDGPGCWLQTDVADAIFPELGQLLSQELRCTVTSIGRAEDVLAYEVAQGGSVVEKLAAKGAEVLDQANSRHAAAVGAGQPLGDVLEPTWLAALDMDFETARSARRAMVLGFAPRRSQSEEIIEIDPLLECPVCKSAMKTVQGPHGPFFGCVRFPDCRGRYTVKQAEAARRR